MGLVWSIRFLMAAFRSSGGMNEVSIPNVMLKVS